MFLVLYQWTCFIVLLTYFIVVIMVLCNIDFNFLLSHVCIISFIDFTL